MHRSFRWRCELMASKWWCYLLPNVQSEWPVPVVCGTEQPRKLFPTACLSIYRDSTSVSMGTVTRMTNGGQTWTHQWRKRKTHDWQRVRRWKWLKDEPRTLTGNQSHVSHVLTLSISTSTPSALSHSIKTLESLQENEKAHIVGINSNHNNNNKKRQWKSG